MQQIESLPTVMFGTSHLESGTTIAHMQTGVLILPRCAAGHLWSQHRQHLHPVVFTQRLCKVSPKLGRRTFEACKAEKVALQQQTFEQTAEVAAGPPPQRSFTESWAFKGAAVGVLVALGLSILKRLRRRSSVSDLEDRGYLDESRGNADPYLEDVMKNVNKVEYGELSEEQIAAARKRRARGMVDFRKAEPEVPKDHPFAVKQELTPEEEELIQKRLSVRRGAPVQDLSGRRGYPGMELPGPEA